jgi:predicted SnoaL-like aldol condensation-catalyzing enzyme
MTLKDTVLAAAAQLFGDQDPTAVDRWVASDYRQHSSLAPDGPEGLRHLVQTAPAGFRYDLHRAIAEGDLVALHGTYHGIAATPLVAFDIFRVADGKLAEHWDALAPIVESTASGRSQTDGPTAITDLDATAVNKALVTAFVDDVLKHGKADKITDYVSTEKYWQHNPIVGDGMDGFETTFAALAAQGINLSYEKVHRVIAEGNFVLTVGEGSFGPTPTAFYDLFRVENGKIVEHWDVTPEIVTDLPHENGLF